MTDDQGAQPYWEARKSCPACREAGGFNIFETHPGPGTVKYWKHQWVECSLCTGKGTILIGKATLQQEADGGES